MRISSLIMCGTQRSTTFRHANPVAGEGVRRAGNAVAQAQRFTTGGRARRYLTVLTAFLLALGWVLGHPVKAFADVSFKDFVPQFMLDAVKNNEEYSSRGVVAALGADLLADKAAKPAATIEVGKSPINIMQRTAK